MKFTPTAFVDFDIGNLESRFSCVNLTDKPEESCQPYDTII